METSLLQNIIDYCEEHLTEDIRLEQIAAKFYLNENLLNLLFRSICGVTIMEYVRNRRLTLAAEQLKETHIPLIELSYQFGYETPESFSKAFSRFHGFAPSMLRRGNPKSRVYEPLKIELRVSGGFVSEPTKLEENRQENSYQNPYNDNCKKIGGMIRMIKTSEMVQKEDWRILLDLVRKLNGDGMEYKLDGKTMIFAHGLEIALDKIHLTFPWKDDAKVLDYFGEDGAFIESVPGFRYYDTMFEGKKVRCMQYKDCDDLYRNTDLVEIDSTKVHVQSLEFYYENVSDTDKYYPLVKEYLYGEEN